MKFFCCCLFVLSSAIGFSQKFSIQGQVVDTEENALESATIYLEKVADSTLVTYTVSEPSGKFELKGATESNELSLFISYAGFKTIKKHISISEKKEQNLGKIQMETADNQLSEVTITADRAPVKLKKDTLEFNANSFTTRPNANLEELLKKLPGVEINSDGEITVNGKTVNEIKVNGENFFGSDPKIATKNLPKEVIDKIQVSNQKTKSEEFTGKQGDPDNKSINITLKKDANKGFFGRATAGGGTDDRYVLNGAGNIYKDDMRLSILASANNINSSGFSFDDIYGMMGGSAARSVFSGRGQSGITKAENAGINYTNKWNDKLRFNGDYFFGRNDTRQETAVQRENILPDSSYYENSTNTSNLVNDSHRGNFRVEMEFDTLTRLSISPRININSSISNRENSSEILDEERELANRSSSSENDEMYRGNFNNDIDFIRRFGKRGAFLQLRFSSSYNRQKNDNYLYTERRNFTDAENSELNIQDQYIDQDQETTSYSVDISQRSVLSKNLFLDISYDFDNQKSTNNRLIYEAGENNEYTNLNESLSSEFESKSYRHTPNAGINYKGNKWRINTNIGLLNTTLENTNYRSDYSYSSSFNNLYARAGIRLEPKQSQSFSLNYSTNVGVPSIRQLQPVEDRTNPNNEYVGNPNLDPSYSHNIRGGYRNFDFSTHSGLFSYFNLNFTNNSIVARTTVSNDYYRTTTYTNVDGAMSAGLGIFYSKQTKKDEREFRYRLSLNSSYRKNVGFTNGNKYTSESYSVDPSIRFTYAIEDLLEINPNIGIGYNSSKFSISTLNEQSFINQNAGIEITTFWPKNVVFGNDVSYNKYGNVSSEFDNTSILWNSSLSYQFWDKKANVNLKVYDVLDQIIDTRRSIGDDYIQDTNSLVLTQYAMLSFTYNLNTFGGKNFSSRGGRPHRR